MNENELFSSLNLRSELLKSLDLLNYSQMTAVQAQALPPILAGKDVIAQAKTGSGKTAAFGIGLLSKVNPEPKRPQALVLCPTRELADQISQELKKLARFMTGIKVLVLTGGRSFRSQLISLEHPPQIIVATPGRLLDHVNRKTLSLDRIKMLVLDEADRMLDMGFSEDIEALVSALPAQRQTLLFSASYSPEIKAISEAFQTAAVDIKVETTHTPQQIRQVLYKVNDQADKTSLLMALLVKENPASALIFCNTKEQTENLVDELRAASVRALPLHGGLEQRDRDQVLTLFANRSCPIVVATDVAARGIDIKELPLVVNYDMALKPETHVHRIGRTGRAGAEGLAFSFASPREARKLAAIEHYQKGKLPLGFAPEASEIAPKPVLATSMVTLKIAAGRKNKLRKTDVLGALTRNDSQIQARQVGKIDIFDFHTCVAMDSDAFERALYVMNHYPIKGRQLKACRLF